MKNPKILLFVLLLSLKSLTSFSQVSIGWVARYNNQGLGYDAGLALTVDDFGNVYVTGNSYGNQTRQDLVVIKYSPAGTNLWTRRIADTVNNNYMSGFDIKLDEFNNVIAGGIGVYKYDNNGNPFWSSSSDVRFEAIVLDKAGNIFAVGGASWLFLTRKFQPNGNILWTQTYQYLLGGTSKDITMDKNEDVIITGRIPQSQSLNDYMTIKYSNSGALMWERRYNGGNEDAAYAITSDDSNNVYVTGWNRNSSTDILTIKYSPEGDTVWKAVYDGGGFDVGYDIEVDSLGCVYVGGVTNSSSYITIKYDVNGDLLWSRVQISQQIPYFPVLKLDKNRNVYMSFVSFRPGNFSNYAVVKYNNDGVQQWMAEYYNTGFSHIYDLTLDTQANIYVTGASGGGHGYSIATVKFVQTPTQINQSTNNIIPDSYWLGQNFPNPFNPKTVIQYHIPFKGLVSLKVFDVLGNEVAQLLNGNQEAGSYEAEFDGSGFASGIYFYSLYLNESLFDTKRMVLLK